LIFTLLVFAAGIVSALVHEFGHCLFYWIQGVPAAMSLVKEFPLRDITAREYAVGSAGGPFASAVLLGVSIWFFRKRADASGPRAVLSAFILANVFYFLLRGLISLLKRRGGELSDIAGLVGLGYGSSVILYGIISVGALYSWMRIGGVRLSFRAAGSFVGLLVGYMFVIGGVESVDRRLLWGKYPMVQIDDGRTYNEPLR
jgi:hypothetical protein